MAPGVHGLGSSLCRHCLRGGRKALCGKLGRRGELGRRGSRGSRDHVRGLRLVLLRSQHRGEHTLTHCIARGDRTHRLLQRAANGSVKLDANWVLHGSALYDLHPWATVAPEALWLLGLLVFWGAVARFALPRLTEG